MALLCSPDDLTPAQVSQAWALFKETGVRPDGDQELSLAAIEADAIIGIVASALTNSADAMEYSMTIAVAPSFQNNGIGRQLVDSCLAELKSIAQDSGLAIDASIVCVNPIMLQMLGRRGFDIEDLTGKSIGHAFKTFYAGGQVTEATIKGGYADDYARLAAVMAAGGVVVERVENSDYKWSLVGQLGGATIRLYCMKRGHVYSTAPASYTARYPWDAYMSVPRSGVGYGQTIERYVVGTSVLDTLTDGADALACSSAVTAEQTTALRAAIKALKLTPGFADVDKATARAYTGRHAYVDEAVTSGQVDEATLKGGHESADWAWVYQALEFAGFVKATAGAVGDIEDAEATDATRYWSADRHPGTPVGIALTHLRSGWIGKRVSKHTGKNGKASECDAIRYSTSAKVVIAALCCVVPVLEPERTKFKAFCAKHPAPAGMYSKSDGDYLIIGTMTGRLAGAATTMLAPRRHEAAARSIVRLTEGVVKGGYADNYQRIAALLAASGLECHSTNNALGRWSGEYTLTPGLVMGISYCKTDTPELNRGYDEAYPWKILLSISRTPGVANPHHWVRTAIGHTLLGAFKQMQAAVTRISRIQPAQLSAISELLATLQSQPGFAEVNQATSYNP